MLHYSVMWSKSLYVYKYHVKKIYCTLILEALCAISVSYIYLNNKVDINHMTKISDTQQIESQ